MTISDAFALAIQYHQAGQIQKAAQACRQTLAIDPDHADAHHLLGIIEFENGELQLAVEHIRRATELNGTEGVFHLNLGNVFQAQGNLQAALQSYRRAVELRPDLAEAHYNRGTAFLALKRPNEAVDCFRRATELNPRLPEAHNNLGMALQARGELEMAMASYRQALAVRPQFAEPHNNLGNCCHELGNLDEAVAHYRRALALKADYAEAHYNLGNALQAQGHPQQAIDSYRRALALRPEYPEAYSNLGNALKELGDLRSAVACFQGVVTLRPADAESHYNLGDALLAFGDPRGAADCCRRALELNSSHAKAHFNLANASRQLGNYPAAFKGFARTLELQPDYADVHFNRSMLKLLHGDFENGWPEYEWRWKTGQLPQRSFSAPLWSGKPLGAQTILLHAEQGLGDTLQFVRYSAAVKQRNPRATVIVECQRPLSKLLAACPDIDCLIAQGGDLPAFDVHSPLLSLPGILKTTLESIPAGVPYLFADATLVAYWRQRLSNVGGLRIGINWQGRPGHGEFRNRDIPLEHFLNLAQIEGISLVSLQRGGGLGEQVTANETLPILDFGSDLDTYHGPFMDTAAIMKNLDLVITSDTAVAHVAGALGVPTWLALPYVPDWRWLLDRTDSPWYPTMRLFRQKSRGDWAAVFQEITAALKARLAVSQTE